MVGVERHHSPRASWVKGIGSRQSEAKSGGGACSKRCLTAEPPSRPRHPLLVLSAVVITVPLHGNRCYLGNQTGELFVIPMKCSDVDLITVIFDLSFYKSPFRATLNMSLGT